MASPNENRTRAHLSRLSSETLMKLLADAPAPAATPEEEAYLDALVEVILEREQMHPTGLLPDVEQAWEEFQQYYNTPEGQGLSLYPLDAREPLDAAPAPSEDGAPAPTRKIGALQFLRRSFLAAALVFVLVAVVPPALGYENLFHMINSWTDEAFQIESHVNTFDNGRTFLDNTYDELQDALDMYEIELNVIPKWFPEGFILDAVIVNELKEPIRTEIRAYYINGNQTISVFCNKYVDSLTSYEKEHDMVQEYMVGGIQHYIFENMGKQVAVWNQEDVECSISGDVSLDEMKHMLDSIYGD